ncbi:hypothetical protein [Streptomyces sp. NPDC048508]|uniref:hypothetical protein n=1 Tax=Streptomyces sp. NPDC048508 TaxID=3365561 RepID=UPI0037151529
MHISTSKVELYAAIRRDHRAGLSMRALERKYGVTWRTIRKALDSNWPEPRKKQTPRPTRLDPYKPVIDGMLRADLDASPKQKHTVKKIFDRLLDEHAADGISYQMVRAYVAVRRKEVRWEAGRGPEEMFVPQSICRGTRRRSTSVMSTSCWLGCPLAAICSRFGCRTPARRCTGCRLPTARRRSSKAMI